MEDKKIYTSILDYIHYTGYLKNEQTGMLRNKKTVDKLTYILIDDNQNYPFKKFKILVEKFSHYQFITQQSKVNKNGFANGQCNGLKCYYTPKSPPFMINKKILNYDSLAYPDIPAEVRNVSKTNFIIRKVN